MGEKEQDVEPSWPIFLCLSGGGFRATLFHYGCLKRLNEVGLLGRVHAVSATSGGSIAAALLLQNFGRIDEGNFSYTYDFPRFERLLLGLVTRGALGPVAKLVSAYVLYAMGTAGSLFGVTGDGPAWLALACLALGLALHGWLIQEIGQDQAFALDGEMRGLWSRLGVAVSHPAASSVQRFVKMILCPSVLRIETMNALAFGGATLDTLMARPSMYLTAVNLNNGREMVFSQGIAALLDASGCRALWEGRSGWKQHAARVEIAAAVAASSAFPPFFRPVPVYDGERLLGVFADGGVVDNLAIKVAEALAVHIHPARGPRYDPHAGGIASFKDWIKLVLVLDGSRPLVEKQRRSWPRWRTLKRLVDTATSEHGSDAEIAAYNFERNVGAQSRIVSLRFGFPQSDKLSQMALPGFVRRVRTHLDAFNLQECAVLAYCGYSWIDELLRDEPRLFQRLGLGNVPAPTPFEEILPPEFGPWNTDLADVCRTLRVSGHRFQSLRWLRRTLGV